MQNSVNEYLKEWTKLVKNQKIIYDINSNDLLKPFNNITFPISKKIMSTTLAGGCWVKSEKQQLKENRINKIRELNGEEPNIILPEDKYIDGLVSVQPLSIPSGNLFYIDFCYDDPIKTKRKNKLNNINKIIRKEKIIYIQEIFTKNN